MKSEVNANTNAFIMTATLVTASSTPYQAPISSTRTVCGLRWYDTKLIASTRISKTALMSAKSGASGKADTNMVTKPYWRTENNMTLYHDHLPIRIYTLI